MSDSGWDEESLERLKREIEREVARVSTMLKDTHVSDYTLRFNLDDYPEPNQVAMTELQDRLHRRVSPHKLMIAQKSVLDIPVSLWK